jgi:tRNA threonylcarbamoyl adenosine modification protein YeaZ
VTGAEGAGAPRWRLVLDTATRRSTVALGDRARVVAVSQCDSRQRHATIVLEQIQEVLDQAGSAPGALEAIGVGTGPGSFTGLRVGMATAKTIAWSIGIPIVGISTTDALARALDPRADTVAVVLPAGARDVFVAVPGRHPELVPIDALTAALDGRDAVAIDVGPGRLPGAVRQSDGQAAIAGLPAAFLAMLDERLAAGHLDDASTLVPGYVALPRGIAAPAAEVAWSPDLR